MNFEFHRRARDVKKMVRSLVDKEIIPNMKEWDEQGKLDSDYLEAFK